MLEEALDNVIGGIEKALKQAQQRKVYSAEEAEKAAALLRELETAARDILERLEAFADLA